MENISSCTLGCAKCGITRLRHGEYLGPYKLTNDRKNLKLRIHHHHIVGNKYSAKNFRKSEKNFGLQDIGGNTSLKF